MGKEINFDELITPPEFESRCDMFVDEVNEKVSPKYPEIQIYAENWNKAISSHEAMDDESKEVLKTTITKRGGDEAWNSFVNDNTKWDRRKELSSLSENEAEVEIWGFGGKKIKLQFEHSIEEIRDIAVKYRGIYIDDWDDAVDIDNPDGSNAFLKFTFK